MKRRIVIRADGGSTIGMGHVIRCLALAEMLKNDFTIQFAIQDPDESILKPIQEITTSIIRLPLTVNFENDALNFSKYLDGTEIVVLDGYNFKTEYQANIKNKGCKLVVIDDLHSWHHLADVIINHADGIDKSEYSAEAFTKFYLGLDYVLLRNVFLKQEKKNKEIKFISNVFISMGAADFDNNTQKVTEALLAIESIKEINLMLSSINPHLKDIEKIALNSTKVRSHFNLTASQIVHLLQHCEVAICPASSISLESCAVGVGLISGYTADNQQGILNGLIKHKTLVNFGNINLLTVQEIKSKIEILLLDPSVFQELVENQKRMIDGRSPQRLLKVFKELK